MWINNKKATYRCCIVREYIYGLLTGLFSQDDWVLVRLFFECLLGRDGFKVHQH